MSSPKRGVSKQQLQLLDVLNVDDNPRLVVDRYL